jgi:hypothetical protein
MGRLADESLKQKSAGSNHERLWSFYKLGLDKTYSQYNPFVFLWLNLAWRLTVLNGNLFTRCHIQQIRQRIETNRSKKGVNMKVTRLGGMAGMTCLMLMAGFTAIPADAQVSVNISRLLDVMRQACKLRSREVVMFGEAARGALWVSKAVLPAATMTQVPKIYSTHTQNNHDGPKK